MMAKAAETWVYQFLLKNTFHMSLCVPNICSFWFCANEKRALYALHKIILASY